LNDIEWSFCVKIWSEVGIQWVGILAFGENCLEICRATHILLAATKIFSPARDCTGDISVMGLFIGVIRRGILIESLKRLVKHLVNFI